MSIQSLSALLVKFHYKSIFMAQLKLNQHLKIQIDELKSLTNNSHSPVIFYLENISFNLDEIVDFTQSKDRVIIGRIYPHSDIFKESAFQIEIKLPAIYPLDAPKIRFITPIYHPNVGNDGEFRHELLLKTALWSNTTSLVDVVKAIVECIDNPNIDYPINQEIAKEYAENRTEFNRKALEMIKTYSLPRH